MQYLTQAAEDKHVLSLNMLIDYYAHNTDKQETYKELLRNTLLETDEARSPLASPTGAQQRKSQARFFAARASEPQDDKRKSTSAGLSPRRSALA